MVENRGHETGRCDEAEAAIALVWAADACMDVRNPSCRIRPGMQL